MYQNIYIDSNGFESEVYLWDDKLGLSIFPYNDYNYAYKPDSNGIYKSFNGIRLKRVKRYKRDDPNLFESDLPKETRVLTDVYLNDDTPSKGHRVMFFDIEVLVENGLPDTTACDNKIISISYYDKLTDEYIALVLDEKKMHLSTKSVYYYTDEISLLRSFLDKYEEISPTILTGWNTNLFDIPYLYGRIMKLLGMFEASRLSPVGKIKWSKYRRRYQIAGVSCLDYLDLYKKFTYTQQPNYRLTTIAQAELGEGKLEYEGTLNELYVNDLDEFIKYNKRDVEIVVGLDNKLKFIELVRGICHVGHVPYEEFQYSSRFLEGTIVTFLHRKNLIVSNKSGDNRDLMENDDEERFAGAFVKDPQVGKHNWIYSLDLQSLYPSIIMSLNISPETKVGYVDGNVIKDLEGNEKKITKEQLDKFIKENNLCISTNGILYRTDIRGIIPEILETWFNERITYKSLMKEYAEKGNKEKEEFYDRRQHIQKIFLNSLYGVLGLPIFRFFDLDNALAVTSCGQEVIKTSAKYVNNVYNKANDTVDKDYCIYIDTDSLYFSAEPMFHTWISSEFKVDELKLTIQTAEGMELKLNMMYDVLAKKLFNCDSHKLHIKGESIADTGVWIAKKRYALNKIYDLEKKQTVSKIVVKGLDIIRSTFPEAFKMFMNDFIKMILNHGDKIDLDKLVTSFYKSIPEHGYSVIARNTSVFGISKYSISENSIQEFKKATPIHVKAALAYNRLIDYYKLDTVYEKICEGEKVKYIYLKDNNLNLSVIAFKDYNDPPEIIKFIEENYDPTKLFDKELKGKLQDFYNVLHWGVLPMDLNETADNFFQFN